VNIASRCAFPSITKSCPKLFRQPQKLLGVDTAQDCAFNLEHNLTSYNVLRNLPSLCSISYLFVVQMALPPTLKLLLSPTEADCVTSSPYPPAYHPTAHSFIRSQYKVEIVTLIIRKWITNPRKKIWRIGDAGILAEANNKGCNACMEDGDAGIWASAPARVQHPHLAQTLKILPSLNLQSTSSLGK
jgi:hypothetical protein